MNILIPYTGSAMYMWNCTEPDADGLRYIPGVRDRNVDTANTVGNELNIYQLLPNLCDDCYGRVVAIEYCYQFSTTEKGPAVFNWTVLIMDPNENDSRFTILDTISIESCSDDANCSETGKFCDVTNSFTHLNLTRKFAFGVTESSQGNTHSASLLGYHEGQSEYLVNTVQQDRAGRPLSVGSTVANNSLVWRGVRMLWFVVIPNEEIGDISFAPQPTNSSLGGCKRTSTESDDTDTRTRGGETSATSEFRSDSSHDQHVTPTINVKLQPSVGGVVGGVFGGVIGLTVVIVVVIIVLIVIKKHQQTGKYNANGKSNDNAEGYINAVYECDGKAHDFSSHGCLSM